MKKEFAESGDFAAYYAATKWLHENGYSSGSMRRDDPIGIMKGNYIISKWRNLSSADKKVLHGVMTGDKRNGPVMVEIFEDAK